MTKTNEVVLDNLAQRINAEHEACRDAATAAVEHAVRAGELLIEAKAGLTHGDWTSWLEVKCSFADRTARAYMRLARELPKLDEGNRQRVADLSFREALKAVARDVVGLHELTPASLDRALEAAESGDLSALTMAKNLEREEMCKNSFRVADKLVPEKPDDRRIGILSNKDKQQICLALGPNKAGMDLRKNIAALQTEDRYRQRQQDIEEMEERAEGLRKQADTLEDGARDAKEEMGEAMRDDLSERHGPAYHFIETYDYEIPDEAHWQELCKLTKPDDVVDYLTEHPEIAKPLQNGSWGDMNLMAYSENAWPTLSGGSGWNGIGSPDWLQEFFDDGLAPPQND